MVYRKIGRGTWFHGLIDKMVMGRPQVGLDNLRNLFQPSWFRDSVAKGESVSQRSSTGLGLSSAEFLTPVPCAVPGQGPLAQPAGDTSWL